MDTIKLTCFEADNTFLSDDAGYTTGVDREAMGNTILQYCGNVGLPMNFELGQITLPEESIFDAEGYTDTHGDHCVPCGTVEIKWPGRDPQVVQFVCVG